MKWIALFLLIPSALFAQSKNSFQEFQPGGSNYVARLGGCTYGWPACGTCDEESDVAAQWLLDESSGNIVDEVSAITITKQGTDIGYGATASGLWSNLSPGIEFKGAGKGGFSNAGDDASLSLGATEDAVVEWVATKDDLGGYSQVVFTTNRLESAGTILIFWTAANTIKCYFLTDDSTSVYPTWVVGTGYTGDGNIHKFRLVFDRDGNMELFIDGVSQGTASMAAANNKAVTSSKLALGDENNNFPYYGKIYELRWTIGNATNNSGGPGGG